jgi:cell wall-associated NlpC family hydrolase
MAVNKNEYSDIEDLAYGFIVEELGYNTAIACGILANIERETFPNFNPFSVNSIGAYGLIQWLGGRKTNLFNYTKSTNPSALDQLRFMKYELEGSENKTHRNISKLPNTAEGAYEAGKLFGYHYERFSTNPESEEGIKRATLARDTYWAYYSKNPQPKSNNINVGQRIVQIARQQEGKDYSEGATGPDSFDFAGLVFYCYNEAGYFLPNLSADALYDKYKNTAKKVQPMYTAAADLLFYEKDPNSSGFELMAIADGAGGRIYADKQAKKVVVKNGLDNPAFILRVLSESETSSGVLPGLVDSTGDGLDPSTYASLTSYDPYTSLMLTNIKAEGYDYGYLIDMDHGGEFKFYIPEYTEQAGAQWSDISIRGRSVTIKSYDSTSSRSISISLDLYAGAGLYAPKSGESGEDTVSRLHSDMNFVKSLEYPDYTSIVTKPPSVVHLILGSAINIAGVVSGVSVEHLKPLDEYNRAMYIKLSFTVTQIAVNPIDYRDVRAGQYTLISTTDIDSLHTGDSSDATNAPIYAEKE